MLGTGIWLTHVSPEFDEFRVKMKLRWYNRNLLGIHYGGSLYSMCDPWYMFILMATLGSKYIVMDKAAAIRYMKPGKGTLYCTFKVEPARVRQIREELDQVGKKDFTFLCEVKNEQGEVVCEVDKIVYVRKKDFDWEAFNAANSKIDKVKGQKDNVS